MQRSHDLGGGRPPTAWFDFVIDGGVEDLRVGGANPQLALDLAAACTFALRSALEGQRPGARKCTKNRALPFQFLDEYRKVHRVGGSKSRGRGVKRFSGVADGL